MFYRIIYVKKDLKVVIVIIYWRSLGLKGKGEKGDFSRKEFMVEGGICYEFFGIFFLNKGELEKFMENIN